MTSPNDLWMTYLNSLGGTASESLTYTSWHFCDNKECADDLVALVLDGKKRATASSLWALEKQKQKIPKTGDISILTNWDGDAQCIIRTTDVFITPFDEVSEAFAATEGEGDCSLKFWRAVHWNYFSRELASLGIEPTLKMPIICETFEVILS